MEYFLDAFRRYADFTGRATRQQYWMYVLIYVVISVVLSIIDAAIGTMVLAAIFSVVMLVPSISIATRRLHDTGRTGWWQLIGFIPFLGIIILLVFLVQDSHGENKYGPNPGFKVTE
jgi:uncharacterized membrane protein YhaH (DUF805 family)